MVLVLSNEDVARVLTMEACMAALEEGYRESAAGRAVNQLRYDTNMPLPRRPERSARYEFKTRVGIIPKLGVAALRMSSTLDHRPIVYGQERSERLYLAPGGTTVGMVQLYSTATGEPLAFLPDGVLQGMRVGGTYGLAAKYLARKNASTLGLLGSGWQARFQVAAASLARNLSLIKVYSPNRDHREQFAREVSAEYEVNVRAVDTPEEAADQVDIFVSATNATTAIIPGDFVRKGMHVAAVSGRELSADALARGDVVVAHSSKHYLTTFGGEGEGQYGKLVPPKWGSDEEQAQRPLLEDIIAGKVAGRTSEDQVTIYESGSGLGLQFAAVGAKIYELAKQQGLGQTIPTDWFVQTLHT